MRGYHVIHLNNSSNALEQDSQDYYLLFNHSNDHGMRIKGYSKARDYVLHDHF